jgi:hypothetical protein
MIYRDKAIKMERKRVKRKAVRKEAIWMRKSKRENKRRKRRFPRRRGSIKNCKELLS